MTGSARLAPALLQSAGIIAIVVSAVTITTFYLWVRPTPVLTIRIPPLVTTLHVHSGDLLQYDLDYCKHTDVDAEVHYSWSDGVSYPMPGMTMRGLQLGCHIAREAIEVPNIPSGVYKLEIVRVYNPTPLRRVEVKSVSNQFEVINP